MVRELRFHMPLGQKKTIKGFPDDSDCKEFACNAGDQGSIPELEKSSGEGMATYANILAWRIPWTEKPGGLQSWGCTELDMTEQSTFLTLIKKCHPC